LTPPGKLFQILTVYAFTEKVRQRFLDSSSNITFLLHDRVQREIRFSSTKMRLFWHELLELCWVRRRPFAQRVMR